MQATKGKSSTESGIPDVRFSKWRIKVSRESAEKVQVLKALGALRKSQAYAGYKNIGDFEGGAYESEWVSPYTKSASNVDASILVLLLDWSSEGHLMKATPSERRDMAVLGHTPGLDTNVNLRRLLMAHLGQRIEDTFATNLFPFIKPTTMSEKIPPAILEMAAIEFAIPQIQIVNPKLVVCLGKDVFNSMRSLNSLRPIANLNEARASAFDAWGTTFWCQAHTGYFGTMTREREGAGTIDRDWAGMADHFEEIVGVKTLVRSSRIQ